MRTEPRGRSSVVQRPSERISLTVRAGLLLVMGILGVPTGASAHEELQRADPAAGAELTRAPEAIRLSFVNPIQLSFARVVLSGPRGQVELGALRRDAYSANVLVAPIRGMLGSGKHIVQWQVAGPDGHPVRGEYTFVILPGAEGLTTAPDRAISDSATSDPAGETTPDRGTRALAPGPDAGLLSNGFDSSSPLYAAVRWLTFLGLLGVLGAVAFRVLVLSALRRSRHPLSGRIVRSATPGAIQWGIGAGLLLTLALLLRLFAQSYAIHGSAGALSSNGIGAVLADTSWAMGWWLQAGATALTLVGFLLARDDGFLGWLLATLGAAALGFTPALSGHAAAVEGGPLLAIGVDGLHVLGAGGWLGSLLLVVVAGLPAAARSGEERGRGAAALLNAFSPIALFFAAVVVGTGAFSAWMHLGSVDALLTSDYGRVLLLKLAVIALVLGLGAYHWLLARRRLLEHPATADRLRRSASMELTLALVVLAITAVLVATPPPR